MDCVASVTELEYRACLRALPMDTQRTGHAMTSNRLTDEFPPTTTGLQHRVARRLAKAACLLLVIPVVLTSCRKAEQSSHVMTMEGRVQKIKLTSDETGQIEVLYRNKDQQEVIGSAAVTQETEVMINGVLGKLADIREGERIRGEVQVRGKGDKRTQTVLKIYIDRAELVTPDD